MEAALESKAVGGENSINKANEVVVYCASTRGAESWCLTAAESGNAGESGVNVVLSNDSDLQVVG